MYEVCGNIATKIWFSICGSTGPIYFSLIQQSVKYKFVAVIFYLNLVFSVWLTCLVQCLIKLILLRINTGSPPINWNIRICEMKVSIKISISLSFYISVSILKVVLTIVGFVQLAKTVQQPVLDWNVHSAWQ